MEETSVDLASSNESGGYVFAPFRPDDSGSESDEEKKPVLSKSAYRPQASSNSSSGTLPSVPDVLYVSPMELDPRANNWNERYQKLMEQPESIEKYENLRDLARDFEYAAQLYARLIVSEVCLPVESKSIKPSSVIRGAAGGMKFICCGSILFKFALDVQLEDGAFMYGGKCRNDSLAMKSGNHELKGLIAYMASEIKGLCWPLMVVVDYSK